MLVTIDIDDQLLNSSRQFTGIADLTALVHEALTQLIQREAVRRLAALGGSDPSAKSAPRRRPASDPPARKL